MRSGIFNKLKNKKSSLVLEIILNVVYNNILVMKSIFGV